MCLRNKQRRLRVSGKMTSGLQKIYIVTCSAYRRSSPSRWVTPIICGVLLSHWTDQNEAAARAWIDAFFFRVSAMVPPDEMMVLSVEQQIPPTTVKPSSSTTLHGFIDYTAATAVKSVAGKVGCLA